MTNPRQNDHETELIQAALMYAKWDWPVLPLKKQSKELLDSVEITDATTDKNQITQWWSKNPHANVGIKTGRESGIVVLNCDCGEHKDGVQSMKHLYGYRFGHDPVSHTPGWGYHIYFNYPENIDPNELPLPLTYGVDIMSDEHYVVAPPSIHPSEKKYEWQNKPSQGKLSSLPRWVEAEIMSQVCESPEEQVCDVASAQIALSWF